MAEEGGKGFIDQYIPAGCLPISLDSVYLPLLTAISSQRWYFFSRTDDDLSPPSTLPKELQDRLLASGVLKLYRLLWTQGWIQMAYTKCNQYGPYDKQVLGRVRVYLLPRDAKRSKQSPRNDTTKSLVTLIRQLEYSQDCWQGKDVYTSQPQPKLQLVMGKGPMADKYDDSLLDMFNRVPSPNPQPETVLDPDLRWAMNCLLESKIPGLTTTLYPYQGRSASTMLQRELEPGRFLDPRFRSGLDQAGQDWYHDPVSGVILKEPRYYDGARGGILAEEMGTGKTLICLALILTTKSEPSTPPEPLVAETSPRRNTGSLMDMAAAATNKHSVAWKPYFEACAAQLGYDYQHCIKALTVPENRALYRVKNAFVEPRRSNRLTPSIIPPKEVFLSHITLVIVPGNLVKQWQNEISKHTTGLNVLVLIKMDPIPTISELLSYDIILFSDTRFELIHKDLMAGERLGVEEAYSPLERIRFKRCIIDEGHKLGSGHRSWKNDVLRVIERLEISARWVVTGTPSRGLYGVQSHELTETGIQDGSNNRSALSQEQDDIQRIGNLAAKYLKFRPWANLKSEIGDSVADWGLYVLRQNRRDCLVSTLNSLIIRHRLADVGTLLPPVDEKVIVLDGSFQDQLSLNLFSIMIIFNSVQSQRTDMDYFFHERQRKSLLQLVKNLRQASFFGGVFFSTDDITKAVETAEEFLQKKTVAISSDDEDLLKQAIGFGKQATKNSLKHLSNLYHSMPIYVQNFPGGKGKSWSLDDEETGEGPVCTEAGLLRSLQSFLNPCLDAPTSLQQIIDGGILDQQGIAERAQTLAAASDAGGVITQQTSQQKTLAGNTPLGGDYHSAPKSKDPISAPNGTNPHLQAGVSMDPQYDIKLAEPLAQTTIISTVSAKLSYLIDAIIKYQDDEQILIFYDNDNVAFYLASVLEVLQVQHLIYSRAGLSVERRAQYVATFTESSKFRVLLMDISQAAFGLDMRSASRIYFVSPVLNPQVAAQAIGRARRISQQKPVSVETLVLRNSIEEVMIDRREHMTQAEHTRIKNVLDDRTIKEWIRNPKIHPMTDAEEGLEQTAMLSSPQYVFGRDFGRAHHPDEGLITGSPEARSNTDPDKVQEGVRTSIPLNFKGGLKRPLGPDDRVEIGHTVKRQARVAWTDQET